VFLLSLMTVFPDFSVFPDLSVADCGSATGFGGTGFALAVVTLRVVAAVVSA
jgi:hypothetical protein